MGSYAPIRVFFDDLDERIAALPGVVSAAETSDLPLSDRRYDGFRPFYLLDQPGGATEASAQSARNRVVSPDFFELLGVPMLAGRGLEIADGTGPGVAVVNETFARRFFPGQSPLGQRLRYLDNMYAPGEVGFGAAHRLFDELEIVGVVGDIKYRALAEPPEPAIFMSNTQWVQRRRTVSVRSAVESAMN